MRWSLSACCLVGALALGCEKVSERAVEPHGQAAPAARQAQRPRPRAWRLHPETPFTLVGEGLRDLADVQAIQGAMVLVGEPCSAPPGRKTAPPSEVHVAVGDSFRGQTLPALVTPEGTLSTATVLAGRWPDDVWLQLGYVSDENRYDGGTVLAHWNGYAWQFVGRENGLDPKQVLDWYDGARLVAQHRSLMFRGSSALHPFRVLGKTKHAPADLSSLPFEPPRNEKAMVSADYAVLSTYELFVAYAVGSWTRFGIGRASSAGTTSLDTVDVAPAYTGAVRFLVGQLGGKEQAVAWSKLTRSKGPNALWIRSYGRTGFSQLRSPPPFAEDGYTDLWLAGGLLWARQATTIWRGDGGTWSRHATVSHQAQLTATADGTLWVKERNSLHRVDPQGRRREIPLLAESANDDLLTSSVRIFAGVTPDDVWLEAREGEEVLLFRTRAMTNMLRCD